MDNLDKIDELLKDVPLPRIVKVRQRFEKYYIEDIESEVERQISQLPAYNSLRPGMSIAVTAGSRGIDRIPAVIKTVCEMLAQKGAKPFIIPAMGSHGGATSDGQLHVLGSLGITEALMGFPIRSLMEVVQIGSLHNGTPIYIDRLANNADGIVLVNRVKPHTSFKGKYESGLMKMMAIGLGKQIGAACYHALGFAQMPAIIEEVGNAVVNSGKIIFGLAVTENKFCKINVVHAINAQDIPSREPEILRDAYRYLPMPFFRDVDIMVVLEIGKDISGTGCDSNVTGRFNNENFHGDIRVGKLGFLRLSAATKGNANGVGLGDLITSDLYEKIDLGQTYPNALTSMATTTVKIPMILKSDLSVLRAAMKTCGVSTLSKIRLGIIKSSKKMETLYVSENMLEEALENNAEVIGKPFNIPFDNDGRLFLDF